MADLKKLELLELTNSITKELVNHTGEWALGAHEAGRADESVTGKA